MVFNVFGNFHYFAFLKPSSFPLWYGSYGYGTDSMLAWYAVKIDYCSGFGFLCSTTGMAKYITWQFFIWSFICNIWEQRSQTTGPGWLLTTNSALVLQLILLWLIGQNITCRRSTVSLEKQFYFALSSLLPYIIVKCSTFVLSVVSYGGPSNLM